MTGGDSDQAIIRRILSGEKSSYALLVQRYQQDAYKLSLGILRHPADAEDAVSEAMVKAFAALTGRKTGEITSFKCWLLKIGFLIGGHAAGENAICFFNPLLARR